MLDLDQATFMDAAMRGVCDYAPMGVIVTDTELMIRGWNRWLEAQTGRPAGDVIGCGLLEVYPELTARRLDQLYRQALAGQPALVSHRLHRYLLPIALKTEDGPFPVMQQRAQVLPLMEAGRVVGTITFIEDVTDRVSREVEMSAQASRQQVLVHLGNLALSGMAVSSLMDEAAEIVARTLNVEFCNVMEMLADNETLLLRAGVGWQEGRVGQATVKVGTESLAGSTMLSKNPIIINDLRQETRFAASTALREHGIVSSASGEGGRLHHRPCRGAVQPRHLPGVSRKIRQTAIGAASEEEMIMLLKYRARAWNLMLIFLPPAVGGGGGRLLTESDFGAKLLPLICESLSNGGKS
jgi:PAS domain S-box-containing protein